MRPNDREVGVILETHHEKERAKEAVSFVFDDGSDGLPITVDLIDRLRFSPSECDLNLSEAKLVQSGLVEIMGEDCRNWLDSLQAPKFSFFGIFRYIKESRNWDKMSNAAEVKYKKSDALYGKFAHTLIESRVAFLGKASSDR